MTIVLNSNDNDLFDFPPVHVGDDVLPDGVRLFSCDRERTKSRMIYEMQPQVLKIRYVDAPKVRIFRGETKTYNISVPWLIFVIFETRNINNSWWRIAFCFFSNRPYQSMDDKVCYAHLPNVGYYGSICWEFFGFSEQPFGPAKNITDINKALTGRFNSDIYCLSDVFIVEKTSRRTIKMPTKVQEVMMFLDEQTKKNSSFGRDVVWPEPHSIRQCISSYCNLYNVSFEGF